MKIALELQGIVVPPATRRRLRSQLVLGLGRLAGQVRSALFSLRRAGDARGELSCALRIELEHGIIAEALVFETSIEAALERAILRVGRAAARRAAERRM